VPSPEVLVDVAAEASRLLGDAVSFACRSACGAWAASSPGSRRSCLLRHHVQRSI